MLLVLGEARTEFLAEKRFLAAGFHIEGKPGDDFHEQDADFAEGDGSSEKSEQNSTVDGMANGTIRAGANEFVAFFESDHAAPVCAEMPTRPKRDADSGGGHENAKPFTKWSGRKEAIGEPAIVRLRPREKIKAKYKRKRVGKTLRPGFALLGFLAFERGHEPIDTKEKPQRVNPLAGGREVHITASLAARFKMEQPANYCKFAMGTLGTFLPRASVPVGPAPNTKPCAAKKSGSWAALRCAQDKPHSEGVSALNAFGLTVMFVEQG